MGHHPLFLVGCGINRVFTIGVICENKEALII